MIAVNVYFWKRTNSYVVRNSDNISYANLGYSTKQRIGYVRFYDNISNNIIITFKDNELLSDKLKLYDDKCKNSSNVKISD